MNPPVTPVHVGDVVRFRRGGHWQTGEVIFVGRYVAHIRAGDDFLGYATFVENLSILKSTQRKEKTDGNQ
jgi:hypothetical protein